MRSFTTLLFLFVLPLLQAVYADAWQFEKTHGVVVGVLKWKDRSLSPFSNRQRKDQELYALLKSRGAKDLKLLIDTQATKSQIEAAIREKAASAPADGTFYFYYAGHGVQGDKGAFIANYDMDTSQTASTGVSIRKIAELIATNFRGKLVILSGDFCYSGAFVDAQKILTAKGKQVIVLASSTASNQSTGNWTFTQTWIDCLAGLPFCDRNGDRSITLGEVNEEIGEAMKFRERQRNGFSVSSVDLNWGIGAAQGSKAAGTGDYVLAPYQGNLKPARITRRDGNSVRTEFYFYSEKKSESMNAKETKPFAFRREKPNSSIRVLWNGKGYDAKVLKEENGFHYITYPGYAATWNEWVMDDRIITADTIIVEWKGKWYPATVLKRNGNQTLVHYEGFGDDWNEWVPPERIKKP